MQRFIVVHGAGEKLAESIFTSTERVTFSAHEHEQFLSLLKIRLNGASAQYLRILPYRQDPGSDECNIQFTHQDPVKYFSEIFSTAGTVGVPPGPTGEK